MGCKSTTLGEFIDASGGSIQTGPFGTKLKASEYTPTGVPVISVGEVGYGRIRLHDRTPKVDETVWNRMPEYLLEKDDIVFGRKGAVDRSAQIQPNESGYFLGSDGIRVRLDPNHCYPKFIAYQLQEPAHKEWMIQHAAGTTMPSLNEGIIRRIPIVLPPLPEQKAVAHILGSLDDKIELNRQMNATLEAMAQALFKSWFVDFDPVIDNALAAGNPIPEELADRAELRRTALIKGPVNREIASQFPDHFDIHETLGAIPGGWKTGVIRELCRKIQNGGTPKRENPEYWDGGHIPWLTSGEVRQSLVLKVSNCITTLGLENSSAKWLPKQSTVVAMYGATAGQVAFVCTELTTNQAVCGLIPIEEYKYFNYLNLQRSVSNLENLARGSAQQNISKGIIESYPSIIPPSDIVRSFNKSAEPLFEKWISNIQANSTTAKLRDTLLPKLISGELRIPEAESLAKEALA